MSSSERRFALLPVTPSELGAVCELYGKAAAQPARSLGYPKWDNEAEILAEFSLYGSDPYQDLLIACDGARPIAVTGVLAGPADEQGFLIGPAVHPEWEPREVLPALLQAVEAFASRRVKQLHASAPEENAELSAALHARAWRVRERSLEMKWTPDALPIEPGPLAAEPQQLGPGAGDIELGSVAALLARAFSWSGDAVQRLRESLGNYRVDVLWAAERCCAAIVWGPVPETGFARLEYLAVAEELRGSGLGSALLARALSESRRMGIRLLYLNVRQDSAAIRLYTRHGFEPTQRATLFEKELSR